MRPDLVVDKLIADAEALEALFMKDPKECTARRRGYVKLWRDAAGTIQVLAQKIEMWQHTATENCDPRTLKHVLMHAPYPGDVCKDLSIYIKWFGDERAKELIKPYVRQIEEPDDD